MPRLLVRLFAVIGLFSVLVAMGLSLLAWRLVDRLEARGHVEVPEAAVLVADWRGGVAEVAPRFGALPGLPVAADLSQPEVLLALQAGAADPRIRALVVRTDGEGFGLAQAQELHQAVRAFAAAGKPTALYADTLGEFTGGMVGTYLAAAFDFVQLQPLGTVGLTGLSIDRPYFARLLDDLGIEVQVIQREAFKSALEPFVRTAPSPEDRATVDRLLDAIFGELVAGIAAARGLSDEAVRAAVDRGPLLGREAVALGLVDAIGHEDALWAHLEAEVGAVERLPLERYARAVRGARAKAAAVVGFVHAVGPIRRGTADPFGAEAGIAGDSLAAAIDTAREARVDALVLRIDSPGGSAVASETVAGAIRRAAAAGIPIVASMAGVAASGGYWLAMDADRIVASPLTLTGSIGVIAGKPSLGALLKEIGVDVVSTRRGANADLFNLVEPWDTSALARLDILLDDTYGAFVEGVAAGRGMSAAAVRAVAGGQVWTGREAVANGLVDALGGFLEALAIARTLAGIDADAAIELRTFPEARPPWLDLVERLDVLSLAAAKVAQWSAALAPWPGLRLEADVPVVR